MKANGSRRPGGDASAFEELVRQYQEIAFRTAYLVVGDADEARDGFLRAHAALGRFRPGAEFRPWLLRIVANAARNRRRSASRRADLALRAFRDAASGNAAPSPEVLPVLVYRVDDLESARRQLTARGWHREPTFEIPHGPVCSFRATGGHRIAIYQLVRPDIGEHFEGRPDF